MKISSFHKHFANNLNLFFNIPKQNVLDHPEAYLGPNYRDLLNFWLYWESLSFEQKNVYWNRYWVLDEETRKLSSEVIDKRFVFLLSSIDLELIASHLYIERCIPFTFLHVLKDVVPL